MYGHGAGFTPLSSAQSESLPQSRKDSAMKCYEDCKWWQSRYWVGCDGYCLNPKSDHYLHILVEKHKEETHPTCGEFEPKEGLRNET